MEVYMAMLATIIAFIVKTMVWLLVIAGVLIVFLFLAYAYYAKKQREKSIRNGYHNIRAYRD